MGVDYVDDKYVDFGEKIHLRCVIRPKCEQDIPFSIRSARWELYNPMGALEAEGEARSTVMSWMPWYSQKAPDGTNLSIFTRSPMRYGWTK